MIIKSLFLINFRNFTKADFFFQPKINLIIAPNGQGKSNLLEAIFYFLEGKSWRSENEKEVLNWRQKTIGKILPFAKLVVLGKEQNNQTPKKFVLALQQTSLESNRISKQLVLNKQKKSPKETTKFFSGMLFNPDSIEIVAGSPENRRYFFDHFGKQLNPLYRCYLQAYQKALQQRNRLLKTLMENPHSKQKEQLFVWNEKLIEAGSFLIQERNEITSKLAVLLSKVSQRLYCGERNLDISYLPSIETKEFKHEFIKTAFQKDLEQNQEREISAGLTFHGPHRDNWEFLLDNHNLKNFGSRGQQRLAVISLLQAALELLEQVQSGKPLVLLDDVFSELDHNHSELLLNFLKSKPYQIFITSASLDPFPETFLTEANVINLNSSSNNS